MNCPVCKTPNAAGATHCNMCYEVFNRSAAQTYLQAMKRERRERDGDTGEPEVVIQTQRFVTEKKAWLSSLDWNALRETGRGLLRRYGLWLVVALVLLTVAVALQFLFSATLWYDVLGRQFQYDFSAKQPIPYLIGMKQDVKIWSERAGGLDTPIDQRSSDEMGNVLVTRTGGKKDASARIDTREWIQIGRDTNGASSRAIALNHPTLAPARVALDKKGSVAARNFTPSTRMGKAIPFIFLRFPRGHLKQGETWKESFEWQDNYQGWKVLWTGTVVWTLGDLIPCGNELCAEVRSTAHLRPRVLDAPEWARRQIGAAQGQATARGVVLFDNSNKKLLSHDFMYQGSLNIPLYTLESIPMEFRVGRRVRGPGEIVIQFDNKIEIRKNERLKS